MATVGILFTKTKAKIGAVVLDASLSEAHNTSNDVTDHPVEKGADITDHVRQKPKTLRLTGLVSNTPLPDPGKPVEFKPEAASTAYQDLMRLADQGETITVVTALRTYEDMVIESLDVPRDASLGQTLQFTCSLKQIRSVETRRVTVSRVSKAKVDGGKRAAKNTPTATKEKSKSGLVTLLSSTGLINKEP